MLLHLLLSISGQYSSFSGVLGFHINFWYLKESLHNGYLSVGFDIQALVGLSLVMSKLSIHRYVIVLNADCMMVRGIGGSYREPSYKNGDGKNCYYIG